MNERHFSLLTKGVLVAWIALVVLAICFLIATCLSAEATDYGSYANLCDMDDVDCGVLSDGSLLQWDPGAGTWTSGVDLSVQGDAYFANFLRGPMSGIECLDQTAQSIEITQVPLTINGNLYNFSDKSDEGCFGCGMGAMLILIIPPDSFIAFSWNCCDNQGPVTFPGLPQENLTKGHSISAYGVSVGANRAVIYGFSDAAIIDWMFDNMLAPGGFVLDYQVPVFEWDGSSCGWTYTPTSVARACSSGCTPGDVGDPVEFNGASVTWSPAIIADCGGDGLYCRGGDNAGETCTGDPDCPGSTCATGGCEHSSFDGSPPSLTGETFEPSPSYFWQIDETGSMSLAGDLSVGGDGQFAGDVVIDGNLHVLGTSGMGTTPFGPAGLNVVHEYTLGDDLGLGCGFGSYATPDGTTDETGSLLAGFYGYAELREASSSEWGQLFGGYFSATTRGTVDVGLANAMIAGVQHSGSGTIEEANVLYLLLQAIGTGGGITDLNYIRPEGYQQIFWTGTNEIENYTFTRIPDVTGSTRCAGGTENGESCLLSDAACIAGGGTCVTETGRITTSANGYIIEEQTDPTLGFGLDVGWRSRFRDNIPLWFGTSLDVGFSSDSTGVVDIFPGATDGDVSFDLDGDGFLLFPQGMKIGDGGSTDYVQIGADGVVALYGSARVIKELNLDPNIPAKGSGTYNPPGTGVLSDFPFLLFDASTVESVLYHWEVPHDYNSAGTVEVYFELLVNSPPVTDKSVVMGVEYKKVTEAGVFSFSSGTSSGTVTELIPGGEAANTIHKTDEITLTTTGWNPGDSVLLRFYRDATNASDDLTVDAWIQNFDVEYLSNKLGETT